MPYSPALHVTARECRQTTWTSGLLRQMSQVEPLQPSCIISNHRTLPLAQCIIIKCRRLEAEWSAIFIISPLLHMANVCWNPTCAPLFAEMGLTLEPHSVKYSPDAWTTHSNICSDNMACDRWQYCLQIPQNPLDTFHACCVWQGTGYTEGWDKTTTTGTDHYLTTGLLHVSLFVVIRFKIY